MTERLRELHAELKAIEETISAWCMRMAWPGKAPTPPAQAWERRVQIYDELRTLGIDRPAGFHRKPLP